MSYERIQQDAEPSWGWPAWAAAMGAAKDRFVEAAKTAVKLRFPAQAHPDALNALASDRNLLPRWDEDDTAFRARIGRAWSTWLEAGRAAGLVAELNGAGFATAAILEAADLPLPLAPELLTAPVAGWNVFWVVLATPLKHDGALADGVFGDPGTFGDGGVIAYDLPDRDIALVRATIRKWTPAHARCGFVAVVFDGSQLWGYPEPTDTWGDGDSEPWGTPGDYSVSFFEV